MDGLMMDFPLTLHHFLERAGRLHANKEILTRTPNGIHRYSYRDYYQRTHRVAKALENLGVKPGERVGTLAWNHYRHLELYFAIPCYGAVLHTLNLRLSADDMAYIINHAEDRVIFGDRLKCVRQFVVMGGSGPVPELPGAVDYEELLSSVSSDAYPWRNFDENTA